jgi:hypothetical protein
MCWIRVGLVGVYSSIKVNPEKLKQLGFVSITS